jgi:hypothetical protein
MGKILISNNEARIYRAEGIRFLPGVNEVDEADLRQAGRNHLLRDRFNKRLLTVAGGGSFDFDAEPGNPPQAPAIQPGKGGGALASLTDIDAQAAIELVEQTVDAELLSAWLAAETRKSVKSAIGKQIAAIQPGKGGGE